MVEMPELEELRHDIVDAEDWIESASDEDDVVELRRVLRDVVTFVKSVESGRRDAGDGTVDELRDAIRSEIGGWCVCIHAEVGAGNPCTCDGEN
jgi:hypothetical protein